MWSDAWREAYCWLAGWLIGQSFHRTVGQMPWLTTSDYFYYYYYYYYYSQWTVVSCAVLDIFGWHCLSVCLLACCHGCILIAEIEGHTHYGQGWWLLLLLLFSQLAYSVNHSLSLSLSFCVSVFGLFHMQVSQCVCILSDGCFAHISRVWCRWWWCCYCFCIQD